MKANICFSWGLQLTRDLPHQRLVVLKDITRHFVSRLLRLRSSLDEEDRKWRGGDQRRVRKGESGAHSSLPSRPLETKVPAFLYLCARREAGEFAKILRKKLTTITLPV